MFATSFPLQAHHGAAAYESKPVTLVGTLTDIEYVNPHVQMFFDVKDNAGKTQKWAAEAGSLLGMSRAGWKKTTLKPGDHATFIGRPSKNGAFSMRLLTVVFSNGQKFEFGRAEDYAN